MKTRTLLLLSIATGLLILVAGGIQLIRVAGQEDASRAGRSASGSRWAT